MKAKVPFEFYTSSQLIEITGKRAAHLKEFIQVLKEIDESSIFYHIHHAFREYHFALGFYTNDFAHWIGEVLGEKALAEKLANLNIKEFTSLKELRDKIIEIVERYLSQAVEIRRAPAGQEFYFCRNVGVIQKTKYVAWDLEEFCEKLKLVGLRSLFFHFFEARLRLQRKTNDFSNWIKFNFGDEKLAEKIEKLDPYLYTMDELRDQIIALICERKLSFWQRIRKWLKLG